MIIVNIFISKEDDTP